MRSRLPARLTLLVVIFLVVATGCDGSLDDEALSAAGWLDDFFARPDVVSLLTTIQAVAPIAIIIVGAGLFLFARRTFMRLHMAVLGGGCLAVVLGILGAIIGGIGAFASIYAVNNYFDRLIGSHGFIVTVLGGALVGVIGLVAAMFAAILVAALIGAIGGVATGSSVDIPIVDHLGMPTGFSLNFWSPGDVGNAEGTLGCGAALFPGILVAPIIGAFAAVRLEDGNPLDITTAPWTVVAICLLLVGFIGLLMGLKLGWEEGQGQGSAGLVGAFYGYLFVRLVGPPLGLNYPVFLRIVTYIIGIVLFAVVFSLLYARSERRRH